MKKTVLEINCLLLFPTQILICSGITDPAYAISAFGTPTSLALITNPYMWLSMQGNTIVSITLLASDLTLELVNIYCT